jgi:hypothetical protein
MRASSVLVCSGLQPNRACVKVDLRPLDLHLTDSIPAVVQQGDKWTKMRREQADQLVEFFDGEKSLACGWFLQKFDVRDIVNLLCPLRDGQHPPQTGKASVDSGTPDIFFFPFADEPTGDSVVNCVAFTPEFATTIFLSLFVSWLESTELVKCLQPSDALGAVRPLSERLVVPCDVAVD